MKNIFVNTQSSIKIIGDKTIYFDPYKIEEESHDADIIFITHNHYDHYDIDSINKIVKEDTILVVPEKMAREVFYKNTVLVKPNKEYEILNIKVKTVSSYNIRASFHPKENEWVGYVTETNNLSYYIPGDTDALDENKNISVDIAFIPIGGKFTMDYKEAASFINEIKPKVVIPIHYGSIIGDISLGDQFKELLDDNIECNIVIK